MSDGTTTTRFQYDGGQIAAEYNASNTRLRRYVPGPGVDEPAFWYEGSGIGPARWYHVDERGSVIAVSDQTSIVGINSYDAYGKPSSGNLGRFGYTGQAWLPELGMWTYKARIYNPNNNVARFMQGDPIGYGSGMNLYAYVAGDLVNASDPTGNFFFGPETEFSDGTPGVGYVQGCRSLTCHSYDGMGASMGDMIRSVSGRYEVSAFERNQRTNTFLDWDAFLGAVDVTRVRAQIKIPAGKGLPWDPFLESGSHPLSHAEFSGIEQSYALVRKQLNSKYPPVNRSINMKPYQNRGPAILPPPLGSYYEARVNLPNNSRARIVVDSGNKKQFWYTPTHYEWFIPIMITPALGK